MIIQQTTIFCEEVEAKPSECALTSPRCQLAALWGGKKVSPQSNCRLTGSIFVSRWTAPSVNTLWSLTSALTFSFFPSVTWICKGKTWLKLYKKKKKEKGLRSLLQLGYRHALVTEPEVAGWAKHLPLPANEILNKTLSLIPHTHMGAHSHTVQTHKHRRPLHRAPRSPSWGLSQKNTPFVGTWSNYFSEHSCFFFI